jgi:hypothetical protein
VMIQANATDSDGSVNQCRVLNERRFARHFYRGSVHDLADARGGRLHIDRGGTRQRGRVGDFRRCHDSR